MVSIHTNIASLGAQRQLKSGQGELAVAMTRLSSGLRVNGAKDDAAGLAIAERMGAQVRGMNVALRNANDAISLAQTAEGALGKMGDALQRMRELSVQARNATNGARDRDSLDKEFSELGREISRLIGGTAFNGQAILSSAAGPLVFQVGAGTGNADRMEFELQDLAMAPALRPIIGGPPSTVAEANQAALAAFRALAGEGTHFEEHVSMAYVDATTASGAAVSLIHALTACADTPLFLGDAGALSAGVAGAASAGQARSIFEANMRTDGVPEGQVATLGALVEAVYGAFDGAITGARATIGGSAAPAGIDAVIRDLDAAMDLVNDQRARFGAAQSRFESVIGGLRIAIENQAAARSRIMDADYAQETARLSRGQILQQAGTAMVAQANQLPQQVLALLR